MATFPVQENMSKHIGRAEIFELNEAFKYGTEMGMYISRGIEGRSCGSPYDWGLLSQMIVWAGGGPHLEIGTLFGGSAILAACTQKKFGLNGHVTCVDPLKGYYGNPLDVQSDTNVSIEIVKRNAEQFGVLDDIELVTLPSFPWPLGERQFVSAFIDGSHIYDAVLKDWLHCAERVKKIIQFDNYDVVHHGVAQVVKLAIEHPDWTLLHASGVTAILARPTDIWPKWKAVDDQ